MDGASRRVWCSRRVRDGRWSKYPGGGELTGPPCDSLRRALRPAKWRFARNSQREKEFERSRFCPVPCQSPLSVPRTLWSSRHPIRQSRWRRPASPRPRSGERGSDLLPPQGGEEARARRWAREPGARDNRGRVEPRPRHILPRKTFTTREEFGCLAVPPEIREMGTTRMVRARPSPAWLRRRPRRCSLAGP